MPKKKTGELDAWQARKVSGAYYPSEENQRVTEYMIALRACPEVDWNNPDEIQESINRYLALCHEMGFKPTWTSYSVSVHTAKSTIQAVREGRTHRNIRSMKMLTELSALCEAATVEGMRLVKNPAGYIFELKALYKWSDAPVYQVEQREDLTENTTMKALADKYMQSIVIDDEHQLVKVKEPPIEEVESTAVIVEESDDQRRNY